MADESSSDEVVFAGYSEELSDKPLLLVMRQVLKSVNSKQNTLLTNKLLTNVLNVEFNIHESDYSNLECDIFLNIIKTFLKSWPHWDKFGVALSKANDEHLPPSNILEQEYENLKEYLNSKLDFAKPLAKKASDATNSCFSPSSEDKKDVVMEVQCTRQQLNKLFFDKPHPQKCMTIFNIEDTIPSRIILDEPLSLKGLLNWLFTKIKINLNNFTYTHELVYDSRHVLVNKKLLSPTDTPIALDTDLKLKPSNNCKQVSIFTLLNHINTIKNRMESNVDSRKKTYLNTIFNVVKQDFMEITDLLFVPAAYKKYCNEYAYLRHLYEKVPNATGSGKFDLRLEETFKPLKQFSVTKFTFDSFVPPVNDDWLVIECTSCQESFKGLDALDSLLRHANCTGITQYAKPDFQCSNCKVLFSTAIMSDNYWFHNC